MTGEGWERKGIFHNLIWHLVRPFRNCINRYTSDHQRWQFPIFKETLKKLYLLKYELYINEKPDYFQLWFRFKSVLSIYTAGKYENLLSIYVIVMDIIKCENVFARIFIFSSLFWSKTNYKNLKSQQKLFRTCDTHFNNINKILFSFTQII